METFPPPFPRPMAQAAGILKDTPVRRKDMEMRLPFGSVCPLEQPSQRQKGLQDKVCQVRHPKRPLLRLGGS